MQGVEGSRGLMGVVRRSKRIVFEMLTVLFQAFLGFFDSVSFRNHDLIANPQGGFDSQKQGDGALATSTQAQFDSSPSSIPGYPHPLFSEHSSQPGETESGLSAALEGGFESGSDMGSDFVASAQGQPETVPEADQSLASELTNETDSSPSSTSRIWWEVLYDDYEAAMTSGTLTDSDLALAALEAQVLLDKNIIFHLLDGQTLDGANVSTWYGIGQNGTASGTERPQTIAGGADFDGSNDRISVAHTAEQLLTSGGTIMAWVYPHTQDPVYTHVIMGKASGPAGQEGFRFGFRTTANPGAIAVVINNGGTVFSPDNVAPMNEWHHAAFVFDDSGNVKIYVDGQEEASGTTGAASGFTTTTPTLIGRGSTDDFCFDGLIKLPLMSPDQWTQEEIETYYDLTSPHI